MRASAAHINDLQQRAEEIGGSTPEIEETTDHTHLLALEAAIEAIRAGESGRGFAVLANEVRKLAERTASTTSEITRVIEASKRTPKPRQVR